MNHNPVVDKNLKGLQTRSVEERKAIARKGAETSVQNRQKRKAFKEAFDEAITDDIQKKIVAVFFDILFGSDSRNSDKLKAMELLLKILGEDGIALSKADIGAVDRIVLKFE